VCCDYQPNIPFPALTAGELFYPQKVWLYNIGIYSYKTRSTKMYMCDETTGKKGSNECVSLVKYCVDKYISEEVKILPLFSDGCAGQNKNILMA